MRLVTASACGRVLEAVSWRCAICQVERARFQQVELDSVSYNIMTSAHERAAGWQRAVQALRAALAEGLEAQLLGGNAALSACSKGRSWQHGVVGLGALAARGLRLDAAWQG